MNIDILHNEVSYNQIQSIADEAIFESFLGVKVNLHTKFTNPFRTDKTPGCFYKVYKQKLYFIDNAWHSSKFAFSAYDLVKKIYNITDFSKVKKIIYDRLKQFIIEPSTPIKSMSLFAPKNVKRLYGAYKPFSERELEYWAQFGITKPTLEAYKVFSVKYVAVNTDFYAESIEENPIFCYEVGPAKYKIYRPYESKNRKWVCNTDRDVYPQGWMNLPREGSSLIITKSLKDVMLLKELGYNSIAVHSENTHLKEDVVADLRTRFASIYILLDNDPCGIENSKYYHDKYGFIEIVMTDKDPSDQYKNLGRQSVIDILDSFSIIK